MFDAVVEALRRHQKFVITTHLRPDGDALGSELAMGHALRRLGKTVTWLNADPPPYNLGWLPGADDTWVFDGSLEQRERVDEADAILVMDTNTLDRIGTVGPAVEGSSAQKILIDHHPHPETWFDLSYVQTEASSTGQLVYRILQALDPDLIDTPIATALYTAIMTDTGSFRFSNVTPEVHRIVADLLDRGGIDPTPIHTSVYDTRSVAGIRLLGMVLDTLTLRYEDRVGYVVVSQRALRSTRASTDETEGFVNHVLSIESVQAAVIFTEIDAGIKLSFRSKGDTAVNGWARAFGGGGHPNASGAFVRKGKLNRVVDRVMTAAPKHLGFHRSGPTLGELTGDDASYLSALLDAKKDT
ncbi:MAG: bifunctional oligoribonuclease/PAP phosphatase NrnA [Bacteroidota bacterium]